MRKVYFHLRLNITMFIFNHLECSPDHMGLTGGPRPKNPDGGVRVSTLRMRGNYLSVSHEFPVDRSLSVHHARLPHP